MSEEEAKELSKHIENFNRINWVRLINDYVDLDEENKRLYELVMYLILPKRICNHELAIKTKEAFIEIIKNNLNEETVTIRTKIEEY